MPVLLAHLLSIVSFAMALLLVARVGEQRRQPSNLVAWLLAILLVPYLGVPLYLVFGGRKLRPGAAARAGGAAARAGGVAAMPRDPEAASDDVLTALLCASGASPPTRGNGIELLASGEAAYSAAIGLIESARSEIHVSTLILADDEVGRAIAARLCERARSGVRVRLLLDALFRFRASGALIRRLRSAGVTIAWFMPLWRVLPWPSANLRLHRKIILVDGEQAIVGGMNLAREYLGPDPDPGRWRDLSLWVSGPAVGDIAGIFASDWRFATKADVTLGTDSSARPNATEASVQVVGSGPDVETDRIYDALLTAAFAAKRRLWIATPYFVPDEALLGALLLAARRGVDVRVVVPRQSNHWTADLAGGSALRRLARAGGSVRAYLPGMLHAKAVLIDAHLSVLGSANVDMRSLFLDYEIALVLTSHGIARQLDAWFEDVFQHCGPLAPAGTARALLESVARVLAPLE